MKLFFTPLALIFLLFFSCTTIEFEPSSVDVKHLEAKKYAEFEVQSDNYIIIDGKVRYFTHIRYVYAVDGIVANNGDLPAYDVEVEVHYLTEDGTESFSTIYIGDLAAGGRRSFYDDVSFDGTKLDDYWAEAFWYD